MKWGEEEEEDFFQRSSFLSSNRYSHSHVGIVNSNIEGVKQRNMCRESYVYYTTKTSTMHTYIERKSMVRMMIRYSEEMKKRKIVVFNLDSISNIYEAKGGKEKG